jgi:hypothetical protein
MLITKDQTFIFTMNGNARIAMLPKLLSNQLLQVSVKIVRRNLSQKLGFLKSYNVSLFPSSNWHETVGKKNSLQILLNCSPGRWNTGGLYVCVYICAWEREEVQLIRETVRETRTRLTGIIMFVSWWCKSALGSRCYTRWLCRWWFEDTREKGAGSKRTRHRWKLEEEKSVAHTSPSLHFFADTCSLLRPQPPSSFHVLKPRRPQIQVTNTTNLQVPKTSSDISISGPNLLFFLGLSQTCTLPTVTLIILF